MAPVRNSAIGVFQRAMPRPPTYDLLNCYLHSGSESFQRGSPSTYGTGFSLPVQKQASGTPTRNARPGSPVHILFRTRPPCASPCLRIRPTAPYLVASSAHISPFVLTLSLFLIIESHGYPTFTDSTLMVPALPPPLTAVPAGFQPLSAAPANFGPLVGSVGGKLDILSRSRLAPNNYRSHLHSLSAYT